MRKMHILRWMKAVWSRGGSVVCIALCMTHVVVAQTSEELRTEIGKIMQYDTEISMEQVPGFIVAILDVDTTYTLSFGTRERGSTEPITNTDVYQTGSLTKVFTAHIILRMHARGLLEIDHPLNTFLPEEYRNPSFQGTVREIIQHQSGLPKLPETLGSKEHDLNSPYSGFSKEDLLTWYRGFRPGEKAFKYSHAGYALLEIALEHLTGDPFPKIFQREIKEAYALEQSLVASSMDLAPGYDLALRKTTPWSFQSFAASEGMVSSAADMLRYVNTLMHEENALFWNMQTRTQEKNLWIGPGWYVYTPKKDFPVYVHTGRTSGHAVMVAFTRKTHTAVVVIANSTAGTDDLSLLILRMINRQWKCKPIDNTQTR